MGLTNHRMHQTGGPGTALAKERGRSRHRPAGPGPRRAHPLVMLSLAEKGRRDPELQKWRGLDHRTEITG